MKGDHDSITSHGSSGIAFTDEESIIAHLDNFCNHIRSMIDIIHTLSQFSKLSNDVKNLPRVPRDVVVSGPLSEDDQNIGDSLLKVAAGDISGIRPGASSISSGGSEHSYPAEGTCTTSPLTFSSKTLRMQEFLFFFHVCMPKGVQVPIIPYRDCENWA